MFYGGLAYAILAPLAIVGVIVLAILALSGRSEPDTRGDRAYVLYLSLISFIALFTLFFALVSLASTAGDALFVDDADVCADPYSPECLGGSGFDSGRPGGELRARDVLDSVGIAIAAGAVLVFHRKRSSDLLAEPGFAGSAGARTFTAYLYAVAFTAMAIFIGAVAVGVPAVVRTVAPGLTALGSNSAERDAALSDLVPALVAGGGAVLIYLTHWKAAPRLRRGGE